MHIVKDGDGGGASADGVAGDREAWQRARDDQCRFEALNAAARVFQGVPMTHGKFVLEMAGEFYAWLARPRVAEFTAPVSIDMAVAWYGAKYHGEVGVVDGIDGGRKWVFPFHPEPVEEPWAWEVINEARVSEGLPPFAPAPAEEDPGP